MQIELNGIDYYAYTANHKPRENLDTIVFVHGTAMDHTVWSHQSRYFAYHGYNVVGIDLPGHGLSGGQLLETIEQSGQWLNRILECSRGRAFHIVGHSMGALIALQAATGFAHQTVPLNSLTLVGFSYPMTVSPKLLKAANDDPTSAYSMMTQWSHTSKVGGEPVPGFWSPGMQMSMMENSHSGALLMDLNACNHYTGGEQAFATIQCPTLFICGQQDRMAPMRLAQAWAEKVPGAEMAVIPDCGHSMLTESPDEVLDQLNRFIGMHRTA